MSRRVFVLGTDHRFQKRSIEFTELQHQQFALYVKKTAKENGVAALAEENNPQALKEARIAESTVQVFALELGLKHRHCDPDGKTRNELGIHQENDIIVSQYPNELSEKTIQQQVQESLRARERYWLLQLLEFNTWPVLFICGANHSLPFLNLLGQEDFDAVLIAEDWGAQPDVAGDAMR